jgi:hypothetical protein
MIVIFFALSLSKCSATCNNRWALRADHIPNFFIRSAFLTPFAWFFSSGLPG